jgi:hypothetical protein
MIDKKLICKKINHFFLISACAELMSMCVVGRVPVIPAVSPFYPKKDYL